jgi:hypothetical protein
MTAKEHAEQVIREFDAGFEDAIEPDGKWAILALETARLAKLLECGSVSSVREALEALTDALLHRPSQCCPHCNQALP